ncbi:MAG: DUF1501 domain-containing protein [Verrucomicrobiales bacterium]|nr:DUF1501 domain-containing protein [Verrucomicrobiales bacterium]
MKPPHYEMARSRRDFLARAGAGFGSLALAHLLGRTGALASSGNAPLLRHHAFGRAKSVIFLFMEGGPSHIDLFDPKPLLNKLAGQQLPASFKRPLTAMGEQDSPILAEKRVWKQHGQAGTWVSDWLPHTSTIVDDICVIRSCKQDGLNHVGSVCQMNTGSILAGRPSLGAWATYGLGTENENLPAFVVLTDSDAKPFNGSRNWGTGFMPSTYQGTPFKFGDEPVANLANPGGVSVGRQRQRIDFINQLNRRHIQPRSFQSDLEARINSFELAYRMQAEIPLAVDIADEPPHITELYGIGNPQTDANARNCLLARRLVERGVRFVQVFAGTGSKWDAHKGIEKNHTDRCAESDQPVAALIKDLKQRGLLDETLVIWGGEFGRTPMSEQGDGRDHNPWGFTMWMAGGGVKGGQTLGATDELGLYATEDPQHVHDLHSTILWSLGLDARKLIFMNNGTMENPVINQGDPFLKVFG